MVLGLPVRLAPHGNAAVSSQRRSCKLSLTLSESTRRDGLRLPVRRSDLYRQNLLVYIQCRLVGGYPETGF